MTRASYTRLTHIMIAAVLTMATPISSVKAQDENGGEIEGCRNVEADDRSERYSTGNPETTFMPGPSRCSPGDCLLPRLDR